MRDAERERDRLLEELRAALRESEVRFDAIVDSLSDPVTIRSPEHQLVYANQAAIEVYGFNSFEEMQEGGFDAIMRTFRWIAEDGRELTTEDLPSVRIINGDDPGPLVVHLINRETGAATWRLLKATPLVDREGTLQGTVMMSEDVTDQRRHERLSSFLAKAANVLAGSLDYERTLANVAELAVPEIADWCGVDLVDEDGRRLRVAVKHSDPERLSLARELDRYAPDELDPEVGIGRVIASGESLLVPEVSDEMLVAAARSDRHLELIRAVGMRSVIIVPMTLGQRMLGALTLVNAESGATFTAQDLALAEQVAARAAVAIENSRLYTQRSQIAHALQQSLLPRRLPEIPGYQLASAYVPAVDGTEVGGDFYDIWPTPGGWMLVIGDVTGKGPAAAALTAQVRYTLRASARFLSSPAALLAHLDEALKQEPSGRRSLCTVLCVRLDPARDELLMAVGGHPLPLLIDRGSVRSVGSFGPLVGGLSGASWEDQPLALPEAGSLLFYTDGVTDTIGADGCRFGQRRLEQLLSGGAADSAEALVATVTEAIHCFERGAQADDMALLALTRLPAARRTSPLPASAPHKVG